MRVPYLQHATRASPVRCMYTSPVRCMLSRRPYTLSHSPRTCRRSARCCSCTIRDRSDIRDRTDIRDRACRRSARCPVPDLPSRHALFSLAPIFAHALSYPIFALALSSRRSRVLHPVPCAVFAAAASLSPPPFPFAAASAVRGHPGPRPEITSRRRRPDRRGPRPGCGPGPAAASPATPLGAKGSGTERSTPLRTLAREFDKALQRIRTLCEASLNKA